jgi:outer membrane receptor protein involved in Fe transport
MANWRLRAQYAYLDLDLETMPASLDVTSPSLAGNSPEHQAALYSFVDLPHDVSVYAGIRYVGELPNQNVPSYVAVDANVAWRFRPGAALSLAVQNLTDDTHPEFEGGTGNLIERSAYLKLQWSF